MKIKNRILIFTLIFIIMLAFNNISKAAQDWSAVWEETEMYGGGKVEYQNPSWTMVDSYIAAAEQISEQELKGLSNEDRLGFIKFVSAFTGDNTGKLQSDIQQYNDPNSQIAKLYRNMESKIKFLESNSSLTDEEKTYIEKDKIIFENFNNKQEGFSSYEEFLANATTTQKINARILGGYFDKAGNIVELTKEQIDQITDEAGEEINESNEASDEIDEMNKPDQSVLDRKPIGLLPESESDGQISMDDTIQGAMDFVNKGQETVIEQTKLQNVIKSLYNILLVVAMVVAVITGLIIAIKFMTSSVEGKAEVKKVLLPYLISCAVTFGAFGIWKLIVEILNNLE